MSVRSGCSSHSDENSSSSELEKYRMVEKEANKEDRVGNR